jgi:tetratricopeptide (TPR) repeat protein
VRITVQLVDTNTDEQVWAEAYDEEFSIENLLAVQSSVALRIAGELRASLSTSEQERIQAAPTDNLEAYEDYILGRQARVSGSRESRLRAIEHFAGALIADSLYVQAWAGLADAFQTLMEAHEQPSRRVWDAAAKVPGLRTTVSDPVTAEPRVLRSEMIRIATEAAEKAVAIDSTVADGFKSLAVVSHFHWFDSAGAERAYLRAIELQPGNAWVRYSYALFLRLVGRVDEGLRQAEHAFAIEPLSRVVRQNLARARYYAGQQERGLREMKEIADEYPSNYEPLWYLATLQIEAGEYQDAIITLRHQMSMMGDNIADEIALLGLVFGMMGQVDSVSAFLGRLDQLETAGVYTSPTVRSWPYIGLGDLDEAFKWLDRAVEERDSWLRSLRLSAKYDPLRSDSRYPELLRRVGLSE